MLIHDFFGFHTAQLLTLAPTRFLRVGVIRNTPAMPRMALETLRMEEIQTDMPRFRLRQYLRRVQSKIIMMPQATLPAFGLSRETPLCLTSEITQSSEDR